MSRGLRRGLVQGEGPARAVANAGGRAPGDTVPRAEERGAVGREEPQILPILGARAGGLGQERCARGEVRLLRARVERHAQLEVAWLGVERATRLDGDCQSRGHHRDGGGGPAGALPRRDTEEARDQREHAERVSHDPDRGPASLRALSSRRHDVPM